MFAGVRTALGLDGDGMYAQAFQAVELMMAEFSAADKSKGFREIISSGASGSGARVAR